MNGGNCPTFLQSIGPGVLNLSGDGLLFFVDPILFGGFGIDSSRSLYSPPLVESCLAAAVFWGLVNTGIPTHSRRFLQNLHHLSS